MKRKEGFLLVLSGPSGVGKGTVCEALIEERDDLTYSTSVTTRKKRPLEKEGENYFFMSLDEFEQCVEDGMFLEHAKVHGNFYGTPKQFVKDQIKAGNIVILEIDVQGALQIKENFSDAIFIFLQPPNLEELRRRIVGRQTETEEVIDLRMDNAKKEVEYLDEYDYAVVNNEVQEAVKNINHIIEAEKLRVMHK